MINLWLKETRKEKGLTLQELAFRAGLDHSQISRIELGRSELNLFTAVRLTFALELSLTDIFSMGFVREGLDIPDIYRNASESPSQFPVFNFNDIEALFTANLLNSGVAAPIVVELIRQFIFQHSPFLQPEKVSLIAPNIYSLLNSSNADYSLIAQYIPDFDFQYPVALSSDFLKDIYLSGGVFILKDLGRYVRFLRNSQKKSLRDLGGAINLTHTALANLEENTNDKTRFEDFINLDNTFNLNGELVTFAWHTAELYMGVHRVEAIKTRKLHPLSSPEIHLIEKLVTISRLFQYHYPEDRSWLDWYRQESLNGFENVLR